MFLLHFRAILQSITWVKTGSTSLKLPLSCPVISTSLLCFELRLTVQCPLGSASDNPVAKNRFELLSCLFSVSTETRSTDRQLSTFCSTWKQTSFIKKRKKKTSATPLCFFFFWMHLWRHLVPPNFKYYISFLDNFKTLWARICSILRSDDA